MADRETMTGHRRIEAAELNRIEIIDGGRRLCLSVRDAAGRPASMSLPIECLNAVVTAVPRSDRDLLADAARSVHRLDSWTLRDEGAGLVLTLHLPDGARIARLMRLYVRVVAVQGLMQVAIILVMARFVTGL